VASPGACERLAVLNWRSSSIHASSLLSLLFWYRPAVTNEPNGHQCWSPCFNYWLLRWARPQMTSQSQEAVWYRRAAGGATSLRSFLRPRSTANKSGLYWFRLLVYCLATKIRGGNSIPQGSLMVGAEVSPGPFTKFILLVAWRMRSGPMWSRVHRRRRHRAGGGTCPQTSDSRGTGAQQNLWGTCKKISCANTAGNFYHSYVIPCPQRLLVHHRSYLIFLQSWIKMHVYPHLKSK